MNSTYFIPVWGWLLLAVGLVVLLLVNALIIWAVWRALKKTPTNIQGAGAGGVAAPRGTGRTLAIVAGVLLLCVAVPVGLVLLFIGVLIFSRTTSESRQEILQQQQAAQRRAASLEKVRVLHRPENAATVEAAGRQVLEMQLQQAQAEVARLQALVSAGVATQNELQAAMDRVAVAKAELTGDPVKVAEARLQAARNQLDLAQEHYQAGVTSNTALNEAKNAVETREAELNLEQARAEHSHDSASVPASLQATAPNPDTAILAEIAAAGQLDFESSRLNALQAIARRPSLNPSAQAALAQTAFDKLEFEDSQMSLLAEIIKHPHFSADAKLVILENLHRLKFEPSRVSVLEQLNQKPMRGAPAH